MHAERALPVPISMRGLPASLSRDGYFKPLATNNVRLTNSHTHRKKNWSIFISGESYEGNENNIPALDKPCLGRSSTFFVMIAVK
jgi:hypothetical protein